MAQTGTISPSPFVKFREQGGTFHTVTWVWAGWSVDGWLSGARYFSLHYVQTSSGAHPVTYSVGSQAIQQMLHATDNPPASNTEIKNQRSYTCVSPIRLHTVHRKNSTLHFTKLFRKTIFIERCCFVQCRFGSCVMTTTASSPNIIHRYAALI
jgi:hypothetical protein